MATPSITFLGTGSAFPSRSYNACCIIDTGCDTLMVDAGGGNGIFAALAGSGRGIDDIRRLFVTHVHTDHLLGAVWILRMLVKLDFDGVVRDRLEVYGNSDVIGALDNICRLTFLPSYYSRLANVAAFRAVTPGDTLALVGASAEFFDCRSKGVMQTGVRVTLDNGHTLACLGDEALTDDNISEVSGCRTVVCGAFCCYADRDIFRPYEKHHHTVLDVARLAAKATVGTLMLVHCEDRDLSVRSARYAAEATTVFDGRLIVPLDGETVAL